MSRTLKPALRLLEHCSPAGPVELQLQNFSLAKASSELRYLEWLCSREKPRPAWAELVTLESLGRFDTLQPGPRPSGRELSLRRELRGALFTCAMSSIGPGEQKGKEVSKVTVIRQETGHQTRCGQSPEEVQCSC